MSRGVDLDLKGSLRGCFVLLIKLIQQEMKGFLEIGGYNMFKPT